MGEINFLTAPIDVYSQWIESLERRNRMDRGGGDVEPPSRGRDRDVLEDGGGGRGAASGSAGGYVDDFGDESDDADEINVREMMTKRRRVDSAAAYDGKSLAEPQQSKSEPVSAGGNDLKITVPTSSRPRPDASRNLLEGTVTITFGDQAENHVGMQKIGQLAENGFSLDDLKAAMAKFETAGCECQLMNLNEFLPAEIEAEGAAILVVRNGVKVLLGDGGEGGDDEQPGPDRVFAELANLKVDKKAKMRGRVVNKHARWNLCFDEKAQEPDYEAGKGRVVAYETVPLTARIRAKLPTFVGEKAQGLTAEGNYYYDVSQCGIGFHGDSERKRVIAMRLGKTMPLHYQWFQRSLPIGTRAKLSIGHGDVYLMSEKATGFDWKKKIMPTLRHAAGCKKYLTIK